MQLWQAWFPSSSTVNHRFCVSAPIIVFSGKLIPRRINDKLVTCMRETNLQWKWLNMNSLQVGKVTCLSCHFRGVGSPCLLIKMQRWMRCCCSFSCKQVPAAALLWALFLWVKFLETAHPPQLLPASAKTESSFQCAISNVYLPYTSVAQYSSLNKINCNSATFKWEIIEVYRLQKHTKNKQFFMFH